MKKIYTILIAILVIGLVTAGVGVLSRNLAISKDYKDALTSIGLTSYNVTDYEFGNIYERCLFKEGAIDTCFRCNDARDCDNKEQERIEGIANATIQRQNTPEKREINDGVTTITEKK